MVGLRSYYMAKDVIERLVRNVRNARGNAVMPSVTVTRSTGSGTMTIVHQLADSLNAQTGRGQPSWAVLDRDLVKRVIEDHRVPKLVCERFLEDEVSGVENVLRGILQTEPSKWTLLQKTTVTVRRLCGAGHVIIVGRGANIMAGGLENVLHVRLVGSVEKRIARVAAEFDLTRKEAAEYIRSTDRARSNFVKEHFDRSVDDPLLYHLVINTDRMRDAEAVQLIGEALRGLRKSLS